MNSFAYTSKHGICCLLLFLSLLTMMPFQALSQSPDTSDPYNNYKVSPSMAVIVVVLISALFFMVFFSLYIRRCSNSSSSTINIPGTTIAGRSRTAARGLDATLINTFPTFVYSDVKGHKIGKGGLECAVCLSEFEDNETLRLIPNCDHVFHVDCIDVWLSSHTTCPVCRANLSTQPGDPVTEPELTDSNVESQEEIVEEVGDSNADVVGEEVEVSNEGQGRTLRRSRTRGSGSWTPRKFPRSHTTGHSLVHPDENTDRFTLKLPAKVRTEIVNKALDRAASMRVLDREESSKRASNQIDDKEKNLNGKKLDPLDQGAKSDRWALSRNRSLLVRASSFLTRVSSMVRSPRVAAEDGEGTSSQPVRTNSTERRRPPV